jgi:hypothetical protein
MAKHPKPPANEVTLARRDPPLVGADGLVITAPPPAAPAADAIVETFQTAKAIADAASKIDLSKATEHFARAAEFAAIAAPAPPEFLAIGWQDRAGATLVLRYADAAHYSARCSADVEAIRAAHPIASAEVTHAPDGTHHVTIRLARV